MEGRSSAAWGHVVAGGSADVCVNAVADVIAVAAVSFFVGLSDVAPVIAFVGVSAVAVVSPVASVSALAGVSNVVIVGAVGSVSTVASVSAVVGIALPPVSALSPVSAMSPMAARCQCKCCRRYSVVTGVSTVAFFSAASMVTRFTKCSYLIMLVFRPNIVN